MGVIKLDSPGTASGGPSAAPRPPARTRGGGGIFEDGEISPQLLMIGGGVLAVVILALALWFAFGRGGRREGSIPANFRPPIPGPPAGAAPGNLPQPGQLGGAPQPGLPGGGPQPGPPGGFPR